MVHTGDDISDISKWSETSMCINLEKYETL